MTTVKERIWNITRLRYDELDDEHKLDLMESTVRIILCNPGWTVAEDMLKVEWSRVQEDQALKRRSQ